MEKNMESEMKTGSLWWGYSQSNGPRLVMDYMTAPNIQGY